MSNTDKKTTALALEEAGQDTEGLLLERLKSSKTDEDYFRWLLFVVGFYRGINKVDSAVQLLEGYISANKSAEQSAHCHLALGQIATDECKFDVALKHFTDALEMGSKKRKVSYVLHNNIGYSLNALGRFVEGERYCRAAIELDWVRASGYRNLGVSLQGQGNIVGAAWALNEAIKADGADLRARQLLDKLITAHPAVAIRCHWTTESIDNPAKPALELPLM